MRWFFILLCAMIALAGCDSQKGWHLPNITGHLPDLRFSLQSEAGPVTDEDFHNAVTLVYFGFAGCSTQCPLVLGRLAHVETLLARDADSVRILFISVDPDHDTPQSLRQYLGTFGLRNATGLTGTREQIATIAKRYRIAYRPDGGSDNIIHSDTVYVFDRDGHARLLATDADRDADMAADLKRLIRP